jgi:histidyl-tRNA synthetase
VALVPLGEAAERKALALAHELRRRGIAVELDYKGNVKRRLQRANKANARAAVILGDNEIAKGVAAVKDLDKGEQTEVALDALPEALGQ